MSWDFLRHSIILVIVLCFSSLTHADVIWIDVRSAVEHKIDNIEGDIRIPHDKIVQELIKKFPNKDTKIRLYCRSGARAGRALSALEKAGYQYVKNVGSIENARKERGLGK